MQSEAAGNGRSSRFAEPVVCLLISKSVEATTASAAFQREWNDPENTREYIDQYGGTGKCAAIGNSLRKVADTEPRFFANHAVNVMLFTGQRRQTMLCNLCMYVLLNRMLLQSALLMKLCSFSPHETFSYRPSGNKTIMLPLRSMRKDNVECSSEASIQLTSVSVSEWWTRHAMSSRTGSRAKELCASFANKHTHW